MILYLHLNQQYFHIGLHLHTDVCIFEMCLILIITK